MTQGVTLGHKEQIDEGATGATEPKASHRPDGHYHEDRPRADDHRGTDQLHADDLRDADRLRTVYGLRKVGPSPASELYRSREISAMTPADVAAFNCVGIEFVFDLRKQSEIRRKPTPDGLYAETLTIAEDVQRPPDGALAREEIPFAGAYDDPRQRLIGRYRAMAHHGDYYALVFHMLCRSNAPTLIHCVNGKDRSGVLCAQLLQIAGFDRSIVMEDYLSTNRWNAAMNETDIAARSGSAAEDEATALRALFEAREEYLDAFMEEIETQWGSFDKYRRSELHLTDADCATVKSLLGTT